MKDRSIYQDIYDRYKDSKKNTVSEKKLLNEIACGIMGAVDSEFGIENDNIPFDQGPDDHARFSDDILNMSLRDLFNQIKGTDEGLYRKLVYYVHDKFHESPDYSNDDMSCSPFESEPDPFENSIDSSPFDDIEDAMTPSNKRVIVIRKESKDKKINADLIVETAKALKNKK